MSRVKKGGLIVSVFSLAVAIASFGYGFHQEKKRIAENFKKNESVNLELNGIEGNWVIKTVEDCNQSKCQKKKNFYRVNLQSDQTKKLSGQVYSIKETVNTENKSYADATEASQSVSGMKNAENVYLKFTPFSDGNKAIEFNGIFFRDDCMIGNFLADDRTTSGKFVAYRTAGTISGINIENSFDQCAAIN